VVEVLEVVLEVIEEVVLDELVDEVDEEFVLEVVEEVVLDELVDEVDELVGVAIFPQPFCAKSSANKTSAINDDARKVFFTGLF
jgi:hypothetical protein